LKQCLRFVNDDETTCQCQFALHFSNNDNNFTISDDNTDGHSIGSDTTNGTLVPSDKATNEHLTVSDNNADNTALALALIQQQMNIQLLWMHRSNHGPDSPRLNCNLGPDSLRQESKQGPDGQLDCNLGPDVQLDRKSRSDSQRLN
jgi:hypothetical protein